MDTGGPFRKNKRGQTRRGDSGKHKCLSYGNQRADAKGYSLSRGRAQGESVGIRKGKAQTRGR